MNNTIITIEYGGEQFKLSINENIGLNLNYEAGDIRKVLAKTTSFSKTVTFPGDANNNQIFKNIYQVTVDNTYNTNRKSYVKVISNGNIVFSGYLKLDQINDNNGLITYECTMYSDVNGLFDDLKDLKLSELDFSEYSHPYTLDTVSGSWETFIYKNGNKVPFQYGMGYVYPDVFWGIGEINANYFDVSYYRPALYAKTILDKCFSTVGYSYKSNFFNSPYFKSLIITQPTDKSYLSDTVINNSKMQAVLGEGNPLVVDDNGVKYYEISSYVDLKVQKYQHLKKSKEMWDAVIDDDFSQGYYDNGDNFNVSTYKYTAPVAGNYHITSKAFLNNAVQFLNQSCSFTASTSFPYHVKCDATYYMQIRIKRNGVDYEPAALASSTEVTDIDITYTKNCEKFQQDPAEVSVEEDFNLLAGDEVYVRIGYSFEDIEVWKAPNIPVNPDVEFFFYEAIPTYINIELNNQPLQAGNTQDFNNFLSDEKCKEFILSLANMFNLYFYIDSSEPDTLIIEPAMDFYNGDVLDWNYKLDKDSEINILPINEFETSQLYLTYKADSDYNNKYYSDRADDEIYSEYKYYNTENDFVDLNSTEKIDVIFAPSPLSIARTPKFIPNQKVHTEIFKLNDNNLREFHPNGKMRILFYNGLKDAGFGGYYIVEGYLGQSLGTVTKSFFSEYAYAGMLDDVDNPVDSLEFNYPKFYLYQRDSVTNGTLFTKFWKDFLKESFDYRNKILVGYFYLTDEDIANLNFTNIIWLRERYWVINKIIDYNPINPSLTKVELRMLINYGKTQEYKSEFNQITPYYYNTGGIGDLGKNNINIVQVKSPFGFFDGNVFNGYSNYVPINSFSNIIYGDYNQIGSNSFSNGIFGGSNNMVGGASNNLVVGENNSLIQPLQNSITVGNGLSGETLMSNAVNTNALNLVTVNGVPGGIYIDGVAVETFAQTGFTSGATTYDFSGFTQLNSKTNRFVSVVDGYITGYNPSNYKAYGSKIFATFSLSGDSVVEQRSLSDVFEKTSFDGATAEVYTDGIDIFIRVYGVAGEDINWKCSFKQVVS